MSLPTGYSFKSRLSFTELTWRLDGLGHGRWDHGDSAWYGNYIRGELWGVRMRIFDGRGQANEGGTYDPGGYMLLDYARGAQPTTEHDSRIRDELFPALEVTEYKRDERND